MAETEYTKGFRAGQQQVAYESYAPNILHTQTRELAAGNAKVLDELQYALDHRARWHDFPGGDDHLIRGID